MARKRSTIAALDIGTQQVGLLVAEPVGDRLEILGVGNAVSLGMRAGRVCDVDKMSQAISIALLEAEDMSGTQIYQVSVSVSGDHVQGRNSHGVVPIENGEVSARAARRVIEAAQAVPLPADHRLLHLMRREYIVDGQGGVSDPVGMDGVRLEANLHVISGCESALSNIIKCCNKAALSAAGLVVSSLASAEAVLVPDEKELGVAVVDIGAGTVELSVFVGGAVVHTNVTPVAGLHITRDLARCLETSMAEAEALKKRHGAAIGSLVDRSVCVEVSGVGKRPPRVVSCRLVADIMQARLEEILELVAESIIASGYHELLTSGLVLTGGTAMTPGIAELASEILRMPVRIGEPREVDGLAGEIDDPSWSTAYGLLLGLREQDMAQPWRSSLGERMLPQWVRRKWRNFSKTQ